MMINSIQIKNFLSHKDAFIKLHPGVNVFLGESDTGKSAIFRAINKLVSNRPSGNEFIRWGQDDCIIALDLSDDKLIEWIYEDGQAKYVLCQKDDERVFKAFGKSVPDEILTALNIEEINFQHQLTNAFLFQSSPGEVARYLNQIVNLNVIDTALYNINHRLKNERNLLANANANSKRIREDLKEYDWLDEAEEKLNIASELESNLNSLRASVLALNELINNLVLADKRSFKYKQMTVYEPQVNDLINLDKEIDGLFTKYDDLKALVDTISKCELDIERVKKIIKAESIILKIDKIDDNLNSLINTRQELNYLVENLEGYESEANRLKKEKNKLEVKLDKLMPDICPLCDQEIKK